MLLGGFDKLKAYSMFGHNRFGRGRPPSLALAQADNPEEPPGAPQPLSELQRHGLEFSDEENKTLKINAIFTEFGTAGIVPTIVWYIVTPASQVGLGVTLTSAATIGIMAGTFAGTGLLTIPLVYYGYKKLETDAEELEQAIKKQEVIRKHNREELFLDLLRLRCMLNERDFQSYIATLDLDENEIDKNTLIFYVNSYYKKIHTEQANYQLQDTQPATVFDQKDSSPQSILSYLQTSRLAQDPAIRQSILQKIRSLNPNLDTELHSGCDVFIMPSPLDEKVAPKDSDLTHLRLYIKKSVKGYALVYYVEGKEHTFEDPNLNNDGLILFNNIELFDKNGVLRNNTGHTFYPNLSRICENLLAETSKRGHTRREPCYRPISKLSDYYLSPVGWGIAGTLVTASGTFGNMWTFAGMLVSAGLCASLPVIGWAIIGAACLAASIVAGYYIGKCVLKNLQRDELKTKLIKRNDALSTVKAAVQKKCLATLDNEQLKIHALETANLKLACQQRDAALAHADDQKKIASLESNLAEAQRTNLELVTANRQLQSNVIPIRQVHDQKAKQQQVLSRSLPSSPLLFSPKPPRNTMGMHHTHIRAVAARL